MRVTREASVQDDRGVLTEPGGVASLPMHNAAAIYATAYVNGHKAVAIVLGAPGSAELADDDLIAAALPGLVRSLADLEVGR